MSYEKVKQAKNMMCRHEESYKNSRARQGDRSFCFQRCRSAIDDKSGSLCKQKGVPVTYVDSMKMLGKACGIEVGAAVAAVVNE